MLLQGSKSVRHVNRVSSSRFKESPRRGGGPRAVRLALCAVLLAAYAGAQTFTDSTITTFAGTGERGFGGDGGSATAAQLYNPRHVAVDGSGNLYIADIYNYRIRKVDSSGVITTVAGTGERGYGGDGGPATEARLHFPRDVAVDGAGNLYIADTQNQRIRKVDSSGVITTVAGTGESGYGGDGGPAVQARLSYPRGVATDHAGNLYIADYNNLRIRKVDSSGVISTVVGTGELGASRGVNGDGGLAVRAQLRNAHDVATDNKGNLYIADTEGNRIRKVDSSGIITTVAGTRESGYGGDGGPAVNARLRHPTGVALDDAGNLYIVDCYNNRIRKVDSSGIITTVAGTGASQALWRGGGDLYVSISDWRAGIGRRGRGQDGPATEARTWGTAARAASTSPIPATTASARWTPSGSSARWRGQTASAGTAARPLGLI